MSEYSSSEKIVTIALPYANGELHLGHISEAVQADIWVRFQRSLGNSCSFISGSDVHGTPIMISANEIKIDSKKFVQNSYIKHFSDLRGFLISLDSFSPTNSIENKKIVNFIYQNLVDNGSIETKYMFQPYDKKKSIFLSDRLIKGICPNCREEEQYGDGCESCGSTYGAFDLEKPYSVLSNTLPIRKKTLHYFFKLSRYRKFLKKWVNSGIVNSSMAHKLNEWFSAGIKDWNISRESPYFGFKIPGERKKYFYVWMDAPLGYIASFIKGESKKFINFLDFWKENSCSDLYHFIGKDIAYFHVLFWASIAKGAGLKLPSAIFVHGFLTLNGKKMSKSRGTLITARNYLKHLNPEYLRYYLSTKFNGSIEDIDLNLDDFMIRVNSDLIGKYANLASRCAKFINTIFDGILSKELDEEDAFKNFLDSTQKIKEDYVNLNTSSAIRKIMFLADSANRYIDINEPWNLAKKENKQEKLHKVCTQGLNMFRVLSIYLSPILPATCERIQKEFLLSSLAWEEVKAPLLNHKILDFKPIMDRITKEKIELLRNRKYE